MLKRLIISCAVSVVMLGHASAAAQIYSTRDSRGIYTSEDSREGLYTTMDSGGIYSSEDKREGLYTTMDAPDAPASDAKHAEAEDGSHSPYRGYLPH